MDPDEPPRLELVAAGGSLPAEVDRLVRLGATTVEGCDGAVVLADPDGVRFRLVEAQQGRAR